MTESDWQALWLTVRLASACTLLLLLTAPGLAWWLSRRPSLFKTIIEALVALPLGLPPTVLGFYLLLALSPQQGFGQWFMNKTGWVLSFHFSGLLLASVLYSLPFVVQPLTAAFRNLDNRYLEIGDTLRLPRWYQFYLVVLPLTLPTFISAALLAFVHTVGEFGVVLMIGGNIPGETRVLSIALFDHVETLNFAAAHQLAGLLLGFSLFVLVCVYGVLGRQPIRLG